MESDGASEVDEIGRPSDSADIRWVPLVGGLAILASVVWVAATAWSGVLASHPAGWVWLVLVALFGVAACAWALLRPVPERSVAWRWTARIAFGLAAVTVVGVTLYTRPHVATSSAVDALADGDGVRVEQSSTRIWMRPEQPRRTGLAFYPGALVDPRSYAAVLRPIAEAGYPVVILKQPFNLAILGVGAAGDVIGADDDIDRWVVGGHSLGGAMASGFAEDDRDGLDGLLLYASYPVHDMSDRDLRVASVYGTADGITEPTDIDDSVADLPPDAVFVAIEGAIHSFFGDYGSQLGDGTPTVERSTAQRQIVEASIELLERVDAADPLSSTG